MNCFSSNEKGTKNHTWQVSVETFSSFFKNRKSNINQKSPTNFSHKLKEKGFGKRVQKHFLQSKSGIVSGVKRFLDKGYVKKYSSCTQLSHIKGYLFFHNASSKKNTNSDRPKAYEYISQRQYAFDHLNISAIIEKFRASSESGSDTNCKTEKVEKTWSEEEDNLFWSQIEWLRETNEISSNEPKEFYSVTCTVVKTSVSFRYSNEDM